MAFWSAKNAAPVQSHKFLVRFGEMKSFTVKSVSKPSVEVSEGVYQVGNQKFKYPGVHTWGDITITFVDDKETTRRLIGELLKQGLKNPDPAVQYGVTTDNYGELGGGNLHVPDEQLILDGMEKGRIGNIQIEQHAVLDYSDNRAGKEAFLRKNDHILETWFLYDAWIKSVNFGQLDYSSDELITLEAVISFDYCTIDYGPTGLPRSKK